MTKELEFMLHMQRLMFEAETLAVEYGVQDKFVSVLFAGLIVENSDYEQKLHAMYSMSVQDFSELQEVLDFLDSAYQSDQKDNLNDDDLNNLLGGTGVELE